MFCLHGNNLLEITDIWPSVTWLDNYIRKQKCQNDFNFLLKQLFLYYSKYNILYYNT